MAPAIHIVLCTLINNVILGLCSKSLDGYLTGMVFSSPSHLTSTYFVVESSRSCAKFSVIMRLLRFTLLNSTRQTDMFPPICIVNPFDLGLPVAMCLGGALTTLC